MRTSIMIIAFICILVTEPTAQQYYTPQDTTIEKPIQYRRGIELQEGYQSYDEKYAGINLNELKRSLFPLESTGIWTELNPKVPRVNYFGIHFVNEYSGWAVGDLGALIKTTDGGESWTVGESNTTTPILKVRSHNGQIVIASGFSGLILRSINGGETFNQIASGVTGDLWGLQMINDTLGWACGNFNSLTKTTDGGQTWQRIFTPGYTGSYWWIDFFNESYGFIAADGKVLRTIDGGNSWEIIQAGDAYPLFSIDVIDSLHIAAAGYGGTGYRGKNIYSSDGGDTWITGGPLTFEAVNDIKYINRDTGYVVMTKVSARKTTNRGQEWTTIQGISDNYELQFLESLSGIIGYSAGTGLRLSRAKNNLDLWNRLIINDNFADVFFVSEEKGFAISSALSSSYNALYGTMNGGNNWEIVHSAPSGTELFFIDSLTGFIGNYTIFKTIDGGQNWYPTNIVTTGEIRRIFFVDSITGWAATQWSPSAKAKILKTTDKGENWFEQITQSGSDSFTSIFFKDSLNGWATSRFVWQTTNSGDNWIQRMDIPAFFGTDIYFYENIGYAIEQLKLFKTTNNGMGWFTQLNSQYIIRNFGWLSYKHGFIVGDGVYETNDSGDTWQEILDLRNVGLRKFQSPVNYIGYSVGSIGLIYKYLDTTVVPVELISFETKIENNQILLTWQTASELNNYGFQIEKSFDKENWFGIGFVAGNGTTTNINHYSFSDNEMPTGIQFYRLKQIDYDGSFEYSKIIKINSSINISSFQLFQNYPNPFNSSTIINYQVPIKSLINISLYDIKGEKILELVKAEKEKGLYEVALENVKLPSGIYFVRMITSAGYSAVIKITQIK